LKSRNGKLFQLLVFDFNWFVLLCRQIGGHSKKWRGVWVMKHAPGMKYLIIAEIICVVIAGVGIRDFFRILQTNLIFTTHLLLSTVYFMCLLAL